MPVKKASKAVSTKAEPTDDVDSVIDSEEETPKPAKAKTPAKGKAKATKEESEPDPEPEPEPEPVKPKSSKAKAAVKGKTKVVTKEESESEAESEPVKPAKTPAKGKAKELAKEPAKEPAKELAKDESDSEPETPPAKPTKAEASIKGKAREDPLEGKSREELTYEMITRIYNRTLRTEVIIEEKLNEIIAAFNTYGEMRTRSGTAVPTRATTTRGTIYRDPLYTLITLTKEELDEKLNGNKALIKIVSDVRDGIGKKLDDAANVRKLVDEFLKIKENTLSKTQREILRDYSNKNKAVKKEDDDIQEAVDHSDSE